MALQLEVTEAAPSCTPDNAENAARRFSGPHWIPAYIPELDGLRGIAAIAVFFYHAQGRLLLPWMAAAAAWGWAGVNLFFVLSGYLITSILLHTREEPRHYFPELLCPADSSHLAGIFSADRDLLPRAKMAAPAA